MNTSIAGRPSVLAPRLPRTAAGVVALALLAPCPQAAKGAESASEGDPAARALYKKMVETMQKATALSWVTDCKWEPRGQTLGQCRYTIWLKKPNFVRLEACRAGEGAEKAGAVNCGGKCR